MRRTTCWTIGMLTCFLSAGCGTKPNGDQTIRVGTFLSATGDMAGNGGPQAVGVAIAIDDVNAAGGVLGKHLSVVNTDDGSDAVKARVAAQTLIDQKVALAIGSDGSSFTLAAAELLPAANIVIISPGSTSPAITTLADNGFVFRTCPSDAFQGKLLAQHAKDKGFNRAAVTNVPNAYGNGLAAAFVATFQALGGTITFNRPYALAQASYSDLLADLYATNPEVVVLPSYPVDAAKIVRSYAQTYGDRDSFWMFTDPLASPDFVAAVGPSSFTTFRHEGTTFASPTGPKWDTFAQAYKTKTGKDAVAGDGAAQAYDALIIGALAIQRAGSTEGAAIRDALYALKGGPGFGPGELKSALAAAAAGQSVEYAGISGPIIFDANGDITSAAYDLWQVKNGAYTVVESNVSPRP